MKIKKLFIMIWKIYSINFLLNSEKEKEHRICIEK